MGQGLLRVLPAANIARKTRHSCRRTFAVKAPTTAMTRNASNAEETRPTVMSALVPIADIRLHLKSECLKGFAQLTLGVELPLNE